MTKIKKPATCQCRYSKLRDKTQRLKRKRSRLTPKPSLQYVFSAANPIHYTGRYHPRGYYRLLSAIIVLSPEKVYVFVSGDLKDTRSNLPAVKHRVSPILDGRWGYPHQGSGTQ